MRTQSRQKTLLVIVVLMVVFAAIWSSWGASRVNAVQDSEEMPSPFGLAQGQSARINVFNPAAEVMTICPCIFDADGNLLIEFKCVRIAPGRMISFDLDGDSVDRVRDRFGRIQIRAVVTTDSRGPSPHISVEVFNNSDGKTTVFISKGFIKGFNLQPDPPGSSK